MIKYKSFGKKVVSLIDSDITILEPSDVSKKGYKTYSADSYSVIVEFIYTQKQLMK